MHYHAGRLVHHQQMLILEDDGQRQLFADNLYSARWRNCHGNLLRLDGTEAGLLQLAIDGDVAMCDQCRGLRAREIGGSSDDQVKALSVAGGRNRQRPRNFP